MSEARALRPWARHRTQDGGSIRLRRWMTGMLFYPIIFLPLLASAADAQRLLAASDSIRNPQKPFSLTLTLLEYRNGVNADSSILNVYSKSDARSGQYRSLVRFASPPRDLNKLMLKAGNELFFYDPASGATIRISPQQRLLGQAANGDVVTANLAKDYRATLVDQEEVVDGERNRRTSHKLLLNAVAPDVTYHRIELWIDSENQRPIKARYYAESGRLLKTAYYRHYRPQLGVARPTEMVIIDGLDPNWVTIMRYSDYAWRDIPDAWLQPDYLSRFAPR
jgi:hypothetical protein